MSLPTKPLGTTGMDITPVGFGAWAIGGGNWRFAWGSQDDSESVAAIRYAVDAGINWIDTAAVYGLGHSEEVVAEALTGIPEPDRPYVFTKLGVVWDETDRMTTRRAMADVRGQVEASLRRLRVERIDLYQVHWPAEDGTPLEEYWQAMADLQAAGKVRAIGLSNHTTAQLAAAEKIAHVGSLQPPFSLLNRTAAAELAWCAAHDTGVIVYSPMASGLLTGAFTQERVAGLPADDWRRTSAAFTTNLDRNLAVAEALRPIAERHGTTPSAVAVAWTLAWPGVTGAIVGARRPAQIDGWLPAATLRLTESDIDELAAVLTRTDAGEGPTRPV